MSLITIYVFVKFNEVNLACLIQHFFGYNKTNPTTKP